MNIIYRQNKRFKINQEAIKEEFRTSQILNGLYAAIYDEFKGASEKDKYKKLTYEQRVNELNMFAKEWLKKRGYFNG